LTGIVTRPIALSTALVADVEVRRDFLIDPQAMSSAAAGSDNMNSRRVRSSIGTTAS
jgi:hypothetical protein